MDLPKGAPLPGPADGLRADPGPPVTLAGPAPAWRALTDREGTGPLGQAVSETFRLYRQACTEEREFAPGLRCGPGRTLLMGILNVTPDSFSDGGRFFGRDRAVEHALRMDEAGADIIDVGGESTRPGAEAVDEAEEADRVLPVLEALRGRTRAALSVDTYKAAVARAALEAGASVVNDVTGLSHDPDMAAAVADADASLVVMHMLGTPRTMQKAPRYRDLFGDIGRSLRASVQRALAAGLERRRVAVDPGIGFGKTVAHNLRLVARLDRFLGLGCPVLLGPSRKSFLGAVLDLPAGERVEGTAAAVTAGILAGARIVRVHDVEPLRRAAAVADALARPGSASP